MVYAEASARWIGVLKLINVVLELADIVQKLSYFNTVSRVVWNLFIGLNSSGKTSGWVLRVIWWLRQNSGRGVETELQIGR